MKKCILTLIFGLIALTPLYSQAMAPANIDTQWEYMVITFGKTNFGSPEKSLAYKTIGLDNANEAISLQKNLDVLGRFGWEAVGIVGQIGGDQQFVLKRKYDKQRVASEVGMISNGKEMYLKELNDILDRQTKNLAEEKKREEENKKIPTLIDLDQEAREKEYEVNKQALISSLETKIKSKNANLIKDIKIKFKNDFYLNPVKITIYYDLTTKFLENGNFYHGDKVRQFFKEELDRYKYVDVGVRNEKSIEIEGVIIFNGKEIYVGSEIYPNK